MNWYRQADPDPDNPKEPYADIVGDQGDLEEAWQTWRLMKATDWRFLPYAGGLLDQPEMLLHNVFEIEAEAQRKDPHHGR